MNIQKEAVKISKGNIQSSTLDIFKYLDKGLSIEEAYKLVKPDRELTRQAKHELCKKHELYSLQNPKRVKKAALAIDKTLSGQIVGDAKQPNASDILTAAKMVLDRAEPVINVNQNLNVNVDISPINLDKYKN